YFFAARRSLIRALSRAESLSKTVCSKRESALRTCDSSLIGSRRRPRESTYAKAVSGSPARAFASRRGMPANLPAQTRSRAGRGLEQDGGYPFAHALLRRPRRPLRHRREHLRFGYRDRLAPSDPPALPARARGVVRPRRRHRGRGSRRPGAWAVARRPADGA